MISDGILVGLSEQQRIFSRHATGMIRNAAEMSSFTPESAAGDGDIVRSIVEVTISKAAVLANAAVLKKTLEIEKSLIDILG